MEDYKTSLDSHGSRSAGSSQLNCATQDPEKQWPASAEICQKKSAYHDLGWLDRLLALWILLSIVAGILLGNFVEDVGPALQRGKFVGVSVPIGESQTRESMLTTAFFC